MYFEETQALMQTFSQEDQAYFQDLWIISILQVSYMRRKP